MALRLGHSRGASLLIVFRRTATLTSSTGTASAPVISYACQAIRFKSSSSSSTRDCRAPLTNGKFLNYAMLYHDCSAFLISNDLGIPIWINKKSKTTPAEVAKEFNLSVRAASALLVTLCRMDVVQVQKDDEHSVDVITYELTPSGRTFLGDPEANSFFSPFIDTLYTNLLSPEKLLESFRPVERKDLMSELLEQDDEEVANNARHFMKHMNAVSYSCAEALPSVLGLTTIDAPITMLDVGHGSAIFSIVAVRANPLVKAIIYELPYIKPITETYIANADVSDRITVTAGDFFTDEPLPSPVDIVLFSNILHDWPDDINMNLLHKGYDCVRPGGKVVISEMLLADDVQSSTSAASSMNIIMINYTKGRQYRAKELIRRLVKVGFVNPCTRELVDDYSLLIAEKPMQ